MIHVCFALHDKTGTYSKFTGTAMLSLFENSATPPPFPSITVHLLHDNTLTDDNRDKLIQIANHYGQLLKFYNVEELCADKIEEIKKLFPKIKDSLFSIAMFYRLFIPCLLLPQGIEKVFYLDSDIIVNLDIAEFWKIELGDKPFGAVPEISQMKDEKASIERIKEVLPIVRDGFVDPKDSFFSGGLLMNLKVLREQKDTILAGMKFVSEHPQYIYLDQDVLNYCFSTSYLRLPMKFNRIVFLARSENELHIEKKIYHYASLRSTLGLYVNDPYNRLFMDYFIKTPWFDADKKFALSGANSSSRKNHVVSVVIPMYNAERYIGECLDSLLNQTFKDFEVIVVDDCSTDNSARVVESFAPKFNGRLKLIKTEKNSGGGGVPRNIGIMLARGEYIQFLDADDVILATALETLYKAAILYEADVVYTSQYYIWDAPNNIVLYKDGTNRKMSWIQTDLTVDDPSTNLSRLLLESGEGNFHNCWTKFVRRDFLAKNRIFFPSFPLGEDFVGVIKIYCHARKFLRISTPLYFYRNYNDHSISRIIKSPQEQCRHWFSSFVKFTEALHDLEKEHEVLAANPLYCLEASKKTFAWTINQTRDARKELTREEIYKILHSEFSKTSSDSLAVLLSFPLSNINEKGFGADSELLDKFGRYFTAKIFVGINKKMEKETIQILSVSDDKANLSKPDWWQRNGTCHVIDSYRGKLEIVAKAVVEGKVQIRLGGPYVENPNDRAKHIPYWIDFTKLVVNGKLLFDKVTPAWNDKHYFYELDAKAGDEIKISVEWLPHRSDSLEVATPQAAPSIDDKFLPYLTARLDAKLTTTAGGDFKILSVSDGNAAVKKPAWFQKGGVGYVIQSHAGNMKLVAKATSNGKLNLKLRSLWVPNPDDKSKLIPYWIDYTKLVINGKAILDKATPAWHDEPFNYDLDVKADEEITLDVEWLPHMGEVAKVAPPPTPTVEKVVEPIVDKFLPYLTARLDAKLTGGDFKIVSVSDNKATVWKPKWLQKGGVGYQIQSHAGNMNLVAKAISAGQLRLKFMSLDIHDPADNSKRLPYWIDYTKLIINGKAIFDKTTPAWHDEPFIYNLDVKADEEITLDVEWLPHKSEVAKFEPPPPPTVEKVEPPVVDKFLPYLTARLDAKLTGGDFKILSVSDGNAAVKKPAWFQKGGVGYVIQSLAGNMSLVAKAISNGQLNLKLRSLWVPDPDDSSKLIPYWIDYTKLIVNGKVIFDKATPAWHDEPFIYNLDVKADEEITLDVEWLPHRGEVPKLAPPPPQIEPPVNKFSTQQRTARLDVKLTTEEGGDFQILSISDDKAAVKKPAWFNKGGVGYVIQSLAGNMKLVAKATSNGQLSLKLRSLWVPNPDDNSKRLPYWIDYTKLIVNDKVIFDKTTPAWHDEPYIYILDVKTGEEITIQTEWLPHESDT